MVHGDQEVTEIYADTLRERGWPPTPQLRGGLRPAGQQDAGRRPAAGEGRASGPGALPPTSAWRRWAASSWRSSPTTRAAPTRLRTLIAGVIHRGSAAPAWVRRAAARVEDDHVGVGAEAGRECRSGGRGRRDGWGLAHSRRTSSQIDRRPLPATPLEVQLYRTGAPSTPGAPLGAGGEVARAELLLHCEVEGAVVGGHGVDHAVLEPLPVGVAVPPGFRRGRGA